MKSTRRIELRTMIPASAMKPIIEVAVKNIPVIQCPGRMPIRVSGIGRHDDERGDEAPEPGDHQHVDQDHDRREGDPHVAARLRR